MIKWFVRWYLKRIDINMTFQIQSLDMELGYNKNLSNEDAQIIKDLADEYFDKRHYLRCVINNILG